jgi:hypothetical protein
VEHMPPSSGSSKPSEITFGMPPAFALVTNSVALVRERTIPTERPPLVGEVSVNSWGKRGVAWSVRRIPYGRNLGFIDSHSGN